MTIEHVLAVVPVADIDLAGHWYERLFGREPDNRPMDGLLEWRASDNGWVQVTQDAERAGTTLLNLAVDDLVQHLDELRSRGLEPSSIQEANRRVQLSSLDDPDGNTITFIGNFRIVY
jgi:hypothetical protein